MRNSLEYTNYIHFDFININKMLIGDYFPILQE